jgi:hypothetical protein
VETFWFESRRRSGLLLTTVDGLEFRRWHVTDAAVRALVVPPMDPFLGGKLHLIHWTPGAALVNDFGFVRAVNGFSQCVVVAISTRSAELTAATSASRSV